MTQQIRPTGPRSRRGGHRPRRRGDRVSMPSKLTKWVSAALSRVTRNITPNGGQGEQRQQRAIKQGGLWKINWT